jgi:hypothetical protein
VSRIGWSMTPGTLGTGSTPPWRVVWIVGVIADTP